MNRQFKNALASSCLKLLNKNKQIRPSTFKLSKLTCFQSTWWNYKSKVSKYTAYMKIVFDIFQ